MFNRLPRTNTAIVGLEDGTIGLRNDVPVPALEPDMVLVRTRAVALNPIDAKMVGKLGTPGAVAGMDFAGDVVAVGPRARTAAPLWAGDRVCGAVPGMHSLTPRVGAFAAVVGAADVTTMRIPAGMSYEQGASLGSGLGTIGLALFRSLRVPGSPAEPAEEPVDVLVYGGSTATGTLAIQLLKLSGHNVIATCSPHNNDLVKSYGASAVFDYHASADAASQIRKHTRSSLKYALDCISEPETMTFCYSCLGRSGGRYCALEPYPEFLAQARPRTVAPDWVLGPVVLGRKLGWPSPFDKEGDPAARDFAVGWFGTAQALLDGGRLRTHPLRVMEGGLESVADGLELLRKKQVSGEKLIYRIGQPQGQLRARLDVRSLATPWVALLALLQAWLLALINLFKH